MEGGSCDWAIGAWVKSGVSGLVRDDATRRGRELELPGRWEPYCGMAVGRACHFLRGPSNGRWGGRRDSGKGFGFGRLDPLGCRCARPGSGRRRWMAGRTPLLAILRAVLLALLASRPLTVAVDMKPICRLSVIWASMDKLLALRGWEE